MNEVMFILSPRLQRTANILNKYILQDLDTMSLGLVLPTND